MNCIRLLRLAERQAFTKWQLSSAQYSMRHPIRFLETQDMWREKDGVSKRWQLIYKAPMDTALNAATTYLTASTSIVGLAGIYYAMCVYEENDFNKPMLLGDEVVIANSPTECLVYLGAFVLLHLAVKVLLSKYVVRLYQDGDEYLAVFRGHYYNSIKLHKFHLKEFKKLRPTLVVSWGDARYDIGNKHAIILENYFKTPEHFNYLLTKQTSQKPDDDD